MVHDFHIYKYLIVTILTDHENVISLRLTMTISIITTNIIYMYSEKVPDSLQPLNFI